MNGALRIAIDDQGVELDNLQAEKLGSAELLGSLQDLGAGGDEGGGVCCLLFRFIFLYGSESLSTFLSVSLLLSLGCCYR
jgi:hypothetical protein